MNDQNPPIERIWKCAWHEGDFWFNRDGEVHPEIIPLFPSHGICRKCLDKQKAILAAMKESNTPYQHEAIAPGCAMPVVDAVIKPPRGVEVNGAVSLAEGKAQALPATVRDSAIAHAETSQHNMGRGHRQAASFLRPGNNESTPIDFAHFGATQ